MITFYKVRIECIRRGNCGHVSRFNPIHKKKSIYLIITTGISKHIFILVVFPPNVLPQKEMDTSSETECKKDANMYTFPVGKNSKLWMILISSASIDSLELPNESCDD